MEVYHIHQPVNIGVEWDKLNIYMNHSILSDLVNRSDWEKVREFWLRIAKPALLQLTRARSSAVPEHSALNR